MYHYWAYGLKIYSEIEFPEMLPISANAQSDVELKLGIVDKVGMHPKGFYSASMDITPDEYRLIIKDIVKFHVIAGKKIVMEVSEGASWDMVRLFCLSNAFAALLHQRKLIPLHAAALLKNDKLVMILGDSGVGKSTTMAGLLSYDLAPYSDDVCVPVESADGQWLFYSSYPMMKFWRSTLELEGIQIKADRQIRPDMEKFGTYFHDQFDISPKKPAAIFVLKKVLTSDSLNLSRVNGMKLFQHLESNAYRAEYINASDLKKQHFHFFTSIAQQVPCYLLERSADGIDHRLVTQMIWKELSKLQHE